MEWHLWKILFLYFMFVPKHQASNLVAKLTCGERNINSSTEKCVENFTYEALNKSQRAKMIFLPDEEIQGRISHELEIEDDGRCYETKFVFRGLTDLQYSSWVQNIKEVPHFIDNEFRNSFHKVVKSQVPVFESKISMCQFMIASPEIEYKACEKVNINQETKDFNNLKGEFENKIVEVDDCKITFSDNSVISIAAGKLIRHDAKQVKVGYRYTYDLARNYCRFQISLDTMINPITSWLDSKRSDKFYPKLNINDTHLKINWGKAKQFQCGPIEENRKILKNYEPAKNENETVVHDTPGYVYVTIQRQGYEKMHSFNASYKEFKTQDFNMQNFTDFPDIAQPRCYKWTVSLQLTLEMFKLDSCLRNIIGECRKSKGRIIQANPFSGKPDMIGRVKMAMSTVFDNRKIYPSLFIKNEDIELTEIDETIVKIMYKNNEGIACLKNLVYAANVLKENETMGELTNTLNISQENTIDITEIMTKMCEESRWKIWVEDVNNNTLKEILIDSLPIVAVPANTTIEENVIFFEVTQEKFRNCSSLRFELKCDDITWTVDQGSITKEAADNRCNNWPNLEVRAFICSNTNCSDTSSVQSQWTSLATGYVSPNRVAETVSGVLVSLVMVTSLCVVVFVTFRRYEQKKEIEQSKALLMRQVTVRRESTASPPHFVFTKGQNLGDHLKEVTNMPQEVMEEYGRLEVFVRDHVHSKMTCNTARDPANIKRNRYVDMVPYDSNIVSLSQPAGYPPSTYVNASTIKFNRMDQEFLAVQAPKPNMFSSFWQLVMEQDVRVIVMITDLVEGGKLKAHQYWPEEEDGEMELDNQIVVNLVSKDSNNPSLNYRVFEVRCPDHTTLRVSQLQCLAWADMTAPKDTHTLRELLEFCDDLVDEDPGKVLVHCSAGVGRTGTFIGFYKMVHDYQNDAVSNIDPFETTLSMRRARVNMVQKPLQYHYMIKCLADYVIGETSLYS